MALKEFLSRQIAASTQSAVAGEMDLNESSMLCNFLSDKGALKIRHIDVYLKKKRAVVMLEDDIEKICARYEARIEEYKNLVRGLGRMLVEEPIKPGQATRNVK